MNTKTVPLTVQLRDEAINVAYNDQESQEILICVIDDQDAIRDAVEDILNASTYKTNHKTKCIAFGDPLVALDYLIETDTLPDLVILDVQMPGMSGLELLRRIRANERTEHILVLVSSGYSDTYGTASILLELADGFLHKPYRYQELQSVVDDFINYKPNDARIVLPAYIRQYIKDKREQEEDVNTDKVSENRSIDVATVQTLSSTLAHNINGEMSVVRQVLHWIETGEYEDEDLKLADQSIDYISVLIRQYMSFLGAQQQTKIIQVGTLVEAFEQFITSRVTSNISLSTQNCIENQTLSVNTNEGILFGGLLELVRNASRAFSGRDGKITIRFVKCDSKVCIEIEDNASGIPPKIIDKLFEDVVHSKSGTGMGLILNKKSLESINHTLYLKETSSDGTTFVIELPIIEIDEDEN